MAQAALDPLPEHDYTGTCWWCGAPADSREHRHKASDLRREFAHDEYAAGDVEIVGGKGNRTLRSPKATPAKFGNTLCARCNNERSQPQDEAYDAFIEWYLANEHEVETTGIVRLDEIYPTWQTGRTHLLGYFIKHVGCRVADTGYEVPDGFREYLDHGIWPPGLVISFEINGVHVGLNAIIKNHPTAQGTAGNLWLGGIGGELKRDSGAAALLHSHWSYHGLQVIWEWSADPNAVVGTNLVGSRPRLPLVDQGATHGLLGVMKPGLPGLAWRSWYGVRRAVGFAPRLGGVRAPPWWRGRGSTDDDS